MTTAVLLLAAAGLVSWSMRVVFVTVVPARRLPAPVLRGLVHAAPSVLAALVVAGLADDGGLAPPTPSPPLAALVCGGLIAAVTRRPLAGIAAAFGCFALLSVL